MGPRPARTAAEESTAPSFPPLGSVQTLSGGVVAFNEERHIEVALESLLRQTLPAGWRRGTVWVVASGCTDRKVEVARRVAASVPRLRVIVEADRGGKARALVEILRRVTGDALVLLNADARASPGAVAELLRRAEGEPAPSVGGGGRAASWRRIRRSRRLAPVAVGLVALVAVNVAASPLDTMLDNIGLGSGYSVSFSVGSGTGAVRALAALIPSGASVIASDVLFPLVANDLHAYSFLWTADPQLVLPFSATNLPSFLFLASARANAVPAWVNATIDNASDYGVRGVAWATPVGTVTLFEEGYASPVTKFRAVPAVVPDGSAMLLGNEALTRGMVQDAWVELRP